MLAKDGRSETPQSHGIPGVCGTKKGNRQMRLKKQIGVR